MRKRQKMPMMKILFVHLSLEQKPLRRLHEWNISDFSPLPPLRTPAPPPGETLHCFVFSLCQKWTFRQNCTQLEKFLVWFYNDLFLYFTFLLFIFVLVLYCFTAPGRKLLYLRCSLYQPEERYPPPGQLMLCFDYESLMKKKTKLKHSSSRNWVLTFSNNSVPSIKNWPFKNLDEGSFQFSFLVPLSSSMPSF